MSHLVGNPEDRFSRVAAHIWAYQHVNSVPSISDSGSGSDWFLRLQRPLMYENSVIASAPMTRAITTAANTIPAHPTVVDDGRLSAALCFLATADVKCPSSIAMSSLYPC